MRRTFGRRWWGPVVLGLLGGTVAIGGQAAANHVFPDSTSNQVFHDNIANIAAAGCATGFPDGTFRPKAAVNRQQFAAWMNRCGGRTAFKAVQGNLQIAPTNHVDGAPISVGSVDIEVGGAPGSLQVVQLDANVVAGLGACVNLGQCFVTFGWYDGNTRLVPDDDGLGTAPPTAPNMIRAGTDPSVSATIPVSAAVLASPGLHTYTLKARPWNVVDGGATRRGIQMQAMVFPFGPTGEDSL